MCVKWRGCSKILTQPYGVLQISGCAHGVQLLLQTQQTPLCALEEGAAMSQPPDCHTGAGCHTQGAGSPLGAPGQPGPGGYERCRCSPESQNHRRAHRGLGPSHPSKSTPAHLPAPGGCQASSIQLRSLGWCLKAFPGTTRGPSRLGETWPKAGGTGDPPEAALGTHPQVKMHHSRKAECSLWPRQQVWRGRVQEGARLVGELDPAAQSTAGAGCEGK